MKNSEKLQIIKRLSKLTQEQLAKKLATSFVTLNSWINERSNPRKRAEQKIDDLYKIFTGQKIVPSNALIAKKELITNKSRKFSNILNYIFAHQDVYDDLILSLTYNSNGIEGSTLSENETAQILFQNHSIPDKSLIEQIEAKNHQAAFQYLLNYLKNSDIINERLILKLHAILMNGIRDDAGFYRTHGVRIVGANVPTANYMKIPNLMRNLVAVINSKKTDSIFHNAKVHSRFEQIHPFSDGNGRVGRLIMTAMLLIKNIPPAIIKQKNRQLYYTFLNKAQQQDDTSLLEDFICDAIMEWLDYVEHIIYS